MTEAEFQVYRCMLGEHRFACLDRLPQQYAIDIGKQIHLVAPGDGDTAEWNGITIVVPSMSVKHLGEIFRIERL